MDFLNTWAQNALCMSAVICLLLLLQPLMEKRFGPGARYYAWLVVAVGLLVPFRLTPAAPLWTISTPSQKPPVVVETPAPFSGERLLGLSGDAGGTVAAQARRPAGPADAVPGPDRPANPSQAALRSRAGGPVVRFQYPDPYTLGVMIWLAGVAAALAIQAVRHIRFFHMAKRWRGEPDATQRAVLDEEAASLGLRRAPRLWRCACVSSPLLAGLIRPVMLMPEVDLTEDELRMVVRHELTHLKRRDLWVKALMLLSLAVHWYNPLVYVMARTMALDCEMSCDASVLANSDLSLRKRYGEAILGVIRRQRKQHIALSTYFYEGKNDMKKRFETMLDTRSRAKGGALVAFALALTLLSGGVIAVAQPAATDAPSGPARAASGAALNAWVPEDWMDHKTPSLFGITTKELTGAFSKEAYQTPETWSRDLTRAEWMRLFDLYYQYDRNGMRAEAPVETAGPDDTGGRFALSRTVEELAALFPMEERLTNGGYTELWTPAREAGALPFLLFPTEREMEDEELLQLIEVIDAFDVLVPYVDVWREKEPEEYNNRDMTRAEMIRYEEIYDRCLRDEAFRPAYGLSSSPDASVYIKGYNGGGEKLYHFPEDREMTDEELLAVAYESAKARLSNMAQEAYYDQKIAPIEEDSPDRRVGTKEEAVSRALALLDADGANVYAPDLSDPPWYNEENGTWQVTLYEGLPLGAGSRYYSVALDLATGDLTRLSQTYFSGVYLISYLGEISANRLMAMPVDAADPRWTELARGYLDRIKPYPGSNLKRVYSDDQLQVNGFSLWAEYEDGMMARIEVDPVTGELKTYSLMSRGDLRELWGNSVNE